MSRDEENEYFADGLAEELLNVIGEEMAQEMAKPLPNSSTGAASTDFLAGEARRVAIPDKGHF